VLSSTPGENRTRAYLTAVSIEGGCYHGLMTTLCLNCETKPAVHRAGAVPGKFCGRSCSTSYNNRLKPKRTRAPLGVCNWEGCSSTVTGPRRSRCGEHRGPVVRAPQHGLYQWPAIPGVTIGEAKALLNRSSDRFSTYLRTRARGYAKRSLDLTVACQAGCGYSKSIVLAHIKPLSDFTDNDLVEDTYTNNLALLCRNCHWEFDHNLLVYAPETGFEPA
jgi:hypothetical protein